jgi:hypothetical protein
MGFQNMLKMIWCVLIAAAFNYLPVYNQKFAIPMERPRYGF